MEVGVVVGEGVRGEFEPSLKGPQTVKVRAGGCASWWTEISGFSDVRGYDKSLFIDLHPEVELLAAFNVDAV